MAMHRDPPSSFYIGSSSTPIVYAEIVPVVLAFKRTADGDAKDIPHRRRNGLHPLTNFGAKQFLLRECRDADSKALRAHTSDFASDGKFFIRWKETNGNVNGRTTLKSGFVFQNKSSVDKINESQNFDYTIDGSNDQREFSLVYIPSDNPTISDRQPCCIIAYAYQCCHVSGANHMAHIMDPTKQCMCHFTRDTLIRILPPQLATNTISIDQQDFGSPLSTTPQLRHKSMLYDLIGEEGKSTIITDALAEEVLQNQDQDAIEELKLKMSACTMPIRIGTTSNAFHTREKLEQQMRKMEGSIEAFCSPMFQKATNAVNDDTNDADTRRCPSLIVHSPNHADGKTLLVQAVAKKLGCSSIHVIRSSVLLAKYSVRADSALESQLHAILVSAACRKQETCIILDHLDMMLPSQLSGRKSSGDAALPILNAIASYLRKITQAMQRKGEIPFPTKNNLYNPGSSDGNSGQVLSVNFCLVGIVTCPDNGWRSQKESSRGGILDSLLGDRYRLPILTAKSILSAFDAAFAREGVSLDPSAKARLAFLAISAPWAKGSVFSRVAKQLKRMMMDSPMYRECGGSKLVDATVKDLEKALATVNSDFATSIEAETSITTDFSPEGKGTKSLTHFASIGGNEHAKVALEDALAFDVEKREMLFRFGLSPPTGVLLYGPPGCGKTLLAKAIARLFKRSASGAAPSTAQSGTFIALSISEIVSAEVGTSEKTIASSFEFAEKNAPSVIFLDEFQALFTDRSRGGSGKLTTTLLQCLDDIKRWYEMDKKQGGGKRIVVIAATNTPWMIDSAFLRSGRFDRVVHVGLPTISERKSILQLHIEKMKVRGGDDMNEIPKLCDHLSRLTEGFSGVDIAALCRAAAVRALEQGEGQPVEEIHFTDAIKFDVFPSSDNNLVQKLKMWRP